MAQLLLVAALARGEDARAAFDAWQAAVDLDHLPPGQYELLPVLHQNLTRLAITHPWLGRLRGVYRKTWYVHHLNLEAGLTLSRACQADGYGPLVLACDAATAQGDEGGARRPQHVLPLLAPAAHAADVVRLARARGWRIEPPSSRIDQPALFAWRSSLILHGPAGQRVRLKWSSRDDWPDPRLDAALWHRVTQAEFRTCAHPVLDDSAALLLACAMASMTSPGLPALADAGLILMHGGVIDWRWLTDTALACQVAAPVRAVLTTLMSELSVDVPVTALAELARAAPAHGPAERLSPHALTRHAQRYRRIAAVRALPVTPPSFLTYLQHTWGLAGRGQLLAHIARRLLPIRYNHRDP